MTLRNHPIIVFFSSLKLTVVLLVLLMGLVFFGTLAQTQMGIYQTVDVFFTSWWVFLPVGSFQFPVWPGGSLVGSLLMINLICAHYKRFQFNLTNSGIWLIHTGLILLLVGSALHSILSSESQFLIREGQTKQFSEDFRVMELAIINTTHPTRNLVVAIPQSHLKSGKTLSHDALPFDLKIKTFYPNVQLTGQTENPIVTHGMGRSIGVNPIPVTNSDDAMNFVTAVIEVLHNNHSHGTWLASSGLTVPDQFQLHGQDYELIMRPKRTYFDFSLKLLDFTHLQYEGTTIPKHFSSKVRLQDQDVTQEILIRMNHPLRYKGYTFFQASFGEEDKLSVLQVVDNPVWLMPYISCIWMGIGLLVHFGLRFFRFSRKAI